LPAAHLHLGDAYFMMENLDAAQREYEWTLVLSPDEPKVHNNYGTLLERRGQADRALAEYKRETEINPDFDLGWVNFARAAEISNQFESAKVALETVTQRNPNLVEAQVGLYGLYVKLGEAKRASILLKSLEARGIQIIQQ
ncbi:MAG: tetratricopeptide repeat protein, partial [Bdellovibrionota bacterium]